MLLLQAFQREAGQLRQGCRKFVHELDLAMVHLKTTEVEPHEDWLMTQLTLKAPDFCKDIPAQD